MFVASQLYDGYCIATRQMLGHLLARAFANDPDRFQHIVTETMDAFDGIKYADREGVSGDMVKHNALAEIELLAKLVPMFYANYAPIADRPRPSRKRHWLRIDKRS